MGNKVREILRDGIKCGACKDVPLCQLCLMSCTCLNIIESREQALLTAVLGCEPEKLPIDPLGIPGRGSGMENDNAWGWNNNGNEYTKNIRKLFGEE